MWYSRFCKVWFWTGGIETLVEVIAEPPNRLGRKGEHRWGKRRGGQSKDRAIRSELTFKTKL